MCGFSAFNRCGIACFDTIKVAARIDLMHQVEAAHVGGGDLGEADGARIVDQHVQTAEGRDGARDGVLHRGLVAHVEHERKRAAAGALDLFRGAVHGSGQLRVRRVGLGRDGDIGAVAGGAQRDGEPDAARGPGDEQRLARKRHGAPPGARALAMTVPSA